MEQPVNTEPADHPVLHLVRPMWGLEEVRGLVVKPFGGDDSPFLLLSSFDDPDLALVVVDPEVVHPGYELEISDEDAGLLDATDPADLVVFAVCNLSEGADASTVNLMAPIVANLHTLAAAQVVLYGTPYPLRAPIAAAAAQS